MTGTQAIRAAALATAVLAAAAGARVEDPAGGGPSAGVVARDTPAPQRADAAEPEAIDPRRARGSGRDDLHHALGMLEYVASDYENAIGEDGTVLDPHEYDEQIEFLAHAERLLAPALAPRSLRLLRELRALQRAVTARRPASVVVPRLRTLHVAIVRDFDVVLTPQQVPSLAAGRILFAEACAACHGTDGRARTERARELVPPPADFHAPALDATLSPYLAFNVITFGVPGTAMASFETLTEEERWSLAFFVCALRHVSPAAAGARAGGNPVPSLTLHDVALASDAQLRAQLDAFPPAERATQLARWRWQLPLEIGPRPQP